jgi:hypothetical protein
LKQDLELCDVLDARADDLLAPSVVAGRGLFDPEYIMRLRKRRIGRPYGRERIYRLWSLLLSELWSRSYLDRRGAALERQPPALLRTEPRSARRSTPLIARPGTANG